MPGSDLASDELLAVLVFPRLLQHVSQPGSTHASAPATTPTAIAAAPDEATGIIYRQCCDAGQEIPELSVLLQVLLDVRQIKGRNHGIDALEVFADFANGFGATEISNYGNEKVLGFEAFQDVEILFVCKVTAVETHAVIRRHQAGVSDSVQSAPTTTTSPEISVNTDDRRCRLRIAGVVID